MRPLVTMQTIQIEFTNACPNQCSGCTRFCGHHKTPFFLGWDQFTSAVDSMEGLPPTCLVGAMGGEPLLHPQFGPMCDYMASKFPREQLGLWTCLPKGKEHYREVIVRTFGNIFLNDQSKEDILHAPVLVASEEIAVQPWLRDFWIDGCWIQKTWSASINPNGAFFCEVAAALSILLDIPGGWKVEPFWWTRSPIHFVDQIKKFCSKCGGAMPLKRRASTDLVDDISPKMFERLKKTSPKIKKGLYEIHDCKTLVEDKRPVATYKDPQYRNKIAARYGMFLTVNEMAYNEPHLLRDWAVPNDSD